MIWAGDTVARTNRSRYVRGDGCRGRCGACCHRQRIIECNEFDRERPLRCTQLVGTWFDPQVRYANDERTIDVTTVHATDLDPGAYNFQVWARDPESAINSGGTRGRGG